MTLSAHNRLSGEVQNVEIDGLTAEITVDIANGETVAAIITRDSAESLDLSEGDTVDAVTKTTAVMIDDV